MKKLILLLSLTICFQAEALTSLVKLPTVIRRYNCVPFNINFHGWTCHSSLCSNYALPTYANGYACGIYVRCRKVNGRYYSCRY